MRCGYNTDFGAKAVKAKRARVYANTLLLVIALAFLPLPQHARAKSPRLITETFNASLMGTVSAWRNGTYLSVQMATLGNASADNGTISAMDMGQRFSTPYYFVRRNFFRFDTRALDGGLNFQSVEIDIYGTGKQVAPPHPTTLRLQKWLGAEDGISTADYSQFDGTNYDLGTITWDSWGAGWQNFTIETHNILTPNGYTDVCLRSSNDINTIPPLDDHTITVGIDNFKPVIRITYFEQSSAKGAEPTPPWWRVGLTWVGEMLETKIRAPVWAMWGQGVISFEGVLFTLIFAYVGFRLAKLSYSILFKTSPIPHIRKQGKRILINVNEES